jgi:hypothetical protein
LTAVASATTTAASAAKAMSITQKVRSLVDTNTLDESAFVKF